MALPGAMMSNPAWLTHLLLREEGSSCLKSSIFDWLVLKCINLSKAVSTPTSKPFRENEMKNYPLYILVVLFRPLKMGGGGLCIRACFSFLFSTQNQVPQKIIRTG